MLVNAERRILGSGGGGWHRVCKIIFSILLGEIMKILSTRSGTRMSTLPFVHQMWS